MMHPPPDLETLQELRGRRAYPRHADPTTDPTTDPAPAGSVDTTARALAIGALVAGVAALILSVASIVVLILLAGDAA